MCFDASSLAICPLDVNSPLAAALRHKIDQKTKPLGALGQLEALALRIGLVQQRLDPVLQSPQVLVFAGDHGIAEEGVSAYPQEVTWQMVMNFLAGGAAVNVLATTLGMAVQVVDAGVKHDFGAATPGLIDAKVAPGTANSARQPAMTPAQCQQALQQGRERVAQAQHQGCNVVALGEMGIGNSSAAALLLHKLAGVPLAQAVGRGTGVDDAGLAHKQAVLARAAARTGPINDGQQALCEYGGFEIAMMAGAMLGAAERRMLILVDGFIASSALLAARHIHPAVTDYAIFTHRSAEAGHTAMLAALQAPPPLLALDLRLGEGTGAVLAWPLVQAAAAFLNQMASFDSAQVAGATGG